MCLLSLVFRLFFSACGATTTRTNYLRNDSRLALTGECCNFIVHMHSHNVMEQRSTQKRTPTKLWQHVNRVRRYEVEFAMKQRLPEEAGQK